MDIILLRFKIHYFFFFYYFCFIFLRLQAAIKYIMNNDKDKA